MTEVAGNVEGTPTGNVTEPAQAPAWLAQLPADLKVNETLTKYPTIGDLGKTHLDVLGKVKELEGKTAELEGSLKNVIPKLPENPTKEQTEAYLTAIGRPSKPEEYEFPKEEGTEHSPEMVSWAQKTFFEAGLSKQQAAMLGKEWNGFIKNMVEGENAESEKQKVENEKAFRAEFKTDDEYKAGYELTKRFWNKITKTNFDEAYKEADAWQVPMFMRFIFLVAKATGEDTSPQGAHPQGGQEVTPGMIYNKTPQHMKK